MVLIVEYCLCVLLRFPLYFLTKGIVFWRFRYQQVFVCNLFWSGLCGVWFLSICFLWYNNAFTVAIPTCERLLLQLGLGFANIFFSISFSFCKIAPVIFLLDDQFIDGPIFKTSVRQKPTYNDGNFSFPQFFLCNFQGVCFTRNFHHDGCVQTDLKRSCPQHPRSFVFGHVFGRDTIFHCHCLTRFAAMWFLPLSNELSGFGGVGHG